MGKKVNYLKRYRNITNTPPLAEKTKRGIPTFVATKGVVTCTVRHMKTPELYFLKPIFMTNATEKDRVLCMCKCCLSMRLKFDVIMSHIKASGGETYGLISDFLMKNYTCDRNENRFYDLKCCNGNCDECGAFSFPELRTLDTTQVNYYTSGVTKTLYVDKKAVPKISQKTERVPHKNVNLKDVVAEFLTARRILNSLLLS